MDTKLTHEDILAMLVGQLAEFLNDQRGDPIVWDPAEGEIALYGKCEAVTENSFVHSIKFLLDGDDETKYRVRVTFTLEEDEDDEDSGSVRD